MGMLLWCRCLGLFWEQPCPDASALERLLHACGPPGTAAQQSRAAVIDGIHRPEGVTPPCEDLSMTGSTDP